MEVGVAKDLYGDDDSNPLPSSKFSDIHSDHLR
jgi:hypothetical protein